MVRAAEALRNKTLALERHQPRLEPLGAFGRLADLYLSPSRDCIITT
jgi:hypothetical protein